MVRHCLEKNPEERFQSARDLTFALESLSQISQTMKTKEQGLAQLAARRWARWLVAGAMVLLFVAGMFLGRESVKPSELKFHRLTFRRGRIHAARFAPDGNTIVYSAAWEEEPIQIFAIRGVGPESLPLGFQGAGLFGISSKGELAIGLNLLPTTTFVSEGTLARAPFSGGAPRPILEKIRFADWSPNGGELAVVRETEKGYQIEYPIGKVLCQGPSGGYISDLRFSPDGLHIAFMEHPTSSSDGYVALVDLTGQKRTLTSHFAGDARGLAWSAKGDEIWFTAAKGGARNELLAVTLSGRDRVLSSQVAQLVLQDISRDGRVLFIANMDYRTKILFRGTGDSRERELSWMDWSQVRDISPDGKQITFDESGEGARDEPSCYLRETNGSAAVKLGPGFAPVLSPDGQSVLAVDQTASGITVFPVGPGEIKNINLKGFVIERVFWLPNGKEVLIGANEAGHGSRIYRMPLEIGTPRAITPEGVSLTRTGVSPDGKYIPGARPSSDKMLLYPVDGGEPQVAEGVLPGEWIANWSADGTALFAYRRNEPPAKVYRVDRRSGRRELVQQITPADRAGVNVASTIKMTPDGKAYAYSISQMLGELHMVEGLK